MSSQHGEAIDRIMTRAGSADRRALRLALQAALAQVIDASNGGFRGDPYAAIEEALEVGAPYGSPEHLAHLEAKAERPGTDPTEALDLEARLDAALCAAYPRNSESPGVDYAAAYGALLGALHAHPETLRALVERFERHGHGPAVSAPTVDR